jgi:hypothetical protein
MSAKCPHCGQDLPAPKEEFDPGFTMVSVEPVPFGERYDRIRAEIEVARKDLRNKGWARLYGLLLDLKRLGSERPELRHFDSVCKVIFNKSGKEVFHILQQWATADALEEIGFDEKILRGDEDTLKEIINRRDPRSFNQDATRKAAASYRHFRMWARPRSI